MVLDIEWPGFSTKNQHETFSQIPGITDDGVLFFQGARGIFLGINDDEDELTPVEEVDDHKFLHFKDLKKQTQNSLRNYHNQNMIFNADIPITVDSITEFLRNFEKIRTSMRRSAVKTKPISSTAP